jgi:hypothetical protein
MNTKHVMCIVIRAFISLLRIHTSRIGSQIKNYMCPFSYMKEIMIIKLFLPYEYPLWGLEENDSS